MSVPNHAQVPKKLFDTGLFDLTTVDGQGAFVDATVAALHAIDERWGHLVKHPGQSNEHGHGEDSALYLSDTPGQSTAVDFIGGAGGPHPTPTWQPDIPRYSEKDWADPFDHGFTEAPPPAMVIPGYEEIGGDAFFRTHVGVPLEDDMMAAGSDLNEGSSVWFARTCYDVIVARMHDPQADVTPIVNKHRNEWRKILGLPPV